MKLTQCIVANFVDMQQAKVSRRKIFLKHFFQNCCFLKTDHLVKLKQKLKPIILEVVILVIRVIVLR